MSEAKLVFNGGLMNGGKTGLLIMEAHSLSSTGVNIVVAKPDGDTKAPGQLESRISIEGKRLRLAAHLIIKQETNVHSAVRETARELGYSCLQRVLIDEVQMLTPEHIDQLDRLVEEGVPVTAYGLTVDFRQRLFPASERLMELADEINILRSGCMSDGCIGDGHANVRKLDGQLVMEGPLVAVEGEHTSQGETTYEVLCRSCYRDAKEKFEAQHGTAHVAL